MDNQRVNHRRRNLPAELKVEIVDCLPVENAVHFLTNVPNRLIIHHCAPRIRRMFEKRIDKIAADYARKLPAPNSDGDIWLINGHQYTQEMDIFLRFGAAHCRDVLISRGTSDGFVGYPANFFDNLIQYYYETKVPAKAVRDLDIDLPLTNAASWPAALVQPQAGEMNVEKLDVDNKWKYVKYILRNKHNPGIVFNLWITFKGKLIRRSKKEGPTKRQYYRKVKCYKQMTGFKVHMMSVESGEA